MHLCVDFHVGPSKEYLIFFLFIKHIWFIRKSSYKSWIFVLVHISGDSSTYNGILVPVRTSVVCVGVMSETMNCINRSWCGHFKCYEEWLSWWFRCLELLQRLGKHLFNITTSSFSWQSNQLFHSSTANLSVNSPIKDKLNYEFALWPTLLFTAYSENINTCLSSFRVIM